MERDDFLQIFKSGFHKLTLKGLRKIEDRENKNGRSYKVYMGLFEFEPPEQVWLEGDSFDYGFLESLMRELAEDDTSNCIQNSFTRKVYDDGGELVESFSREYIFDVVPRNILAFRFDYGRRVMRLVVLGYGMERSS